MHVVGAREYDTSNGYTYVIQNVYKVRQIVPAALPKPVYIDDACSLLIEAGVDETINHPSTWAADCDFDPKAFFADIAFNPPAMVASFNPPGIIKPKAIMMPAYSPASQSSYNSPPTSGTAFRSLTSSVASSPTSTTKATNFDIGKYTNKFSEPMKNFDAEHDSDDLTPNKDVADDLTDYDFPSRPPEKKKARTGKTKTTGKKQKKTVIEIL
jgi:hypothetical protein